LPPQKLEDYVCFNVLVFLGHVYACETFCNLGSSDNLMALSTFEKIWCLELKHFNTKIVPANGSLVNMDGMVENVYVFSLLVTSALEGLFKDSKIRNYSIKKLNISNFRCIDYINFLKKVTYKGLQECPGHSLTFL
jgi:hypothetical protein